jgi:hypothetical protein
MSSSSTKLSLEPEEADEDDAEGELEEADEPDEAW